MVRFHLDSIATRAMTALDVADMTTTELSGRLNIRQSNLLKTLKQLERDQKVRCVASPRGQEANLWTLVRQ